MAVCTALKPISFDKYLFSVVLLLSNDIELNPGPAIGTSPVEHPSPILLKAKGLKIAHLNVCSLINKMDELKLLMAPKSLDVLTISESWLHSNIEDDEFNLPGYSCVRRDRDGRRGGALITYIKPDLNFCSLIDLDNDFDEIQWVNVSRGKGKAVVVVNIYRPPDQHLNDFLL